MCDDLKRVPHAARVGSLMQPFEFSRCCLVQRSQLAAVGCWGGRDRGRHCAEPPAERDTVVLICVELTDVDGNKLVVLMKLIE